MKNLRSWNLPAIQNIRRPSTGTINQTFIVEADRSCFVLRGYQHGNRARIECEHSLIQHVIRKGIPALLPIPLPSGNTLLEHEQKFFALFPFASGIQLGRELLTSEHIAIMGSFLAELHQALAGFMHPLILPRSYRIDAEHTLAQIDAYEQHIRSLTSPQISDGYARKRLAGQRTWIERYTDLDVSDLNTLVCQTTHGDYTESNLFFQNDQVSAIIDWDQAYSAPPTWEIARTLDLVFGFAAQESNIFLEAYSRQSALSFRDLDIAARCYSIMRGHDLWLYSAIYDQHNERIRQFIKPDGFRDLLAMWEKLKAQIC